MSSLSHATGTYPAVGGLPKSLFDYEVLEQIGEGAGSLIYVVSHPTTKQLYALKHVVRKTEKDDRFIEQLEAEFEVGAKAVHANLRRSIEFKVNRTLLRRPTDAALVLELFDGVSLEQSIPRKLTDVVSAFIQTAKGLQALHGLGYVHCDLKPNNILRDAEGRVKVIDLGQAAKIGTVKTRIQGTPDYMAPEQVKLQAVTVKTDVFNFGATMYFALCGKKLPTLFTLKKGENSFLVDGKMESPRDGNPFIPETLSNLVMECVRTVPAKRPEDMTELVRRLEIIEHTLHRDARQHAAASPQKAGVTVRTA